MKKNITAGTIARTLCLLLALVNQRLAVMGYKIIDVSDDTINTLISTGFTVVTALLAWWKNNSFTPAAIKADNYMNELKKGD